MKPYIGVIATLQNSGFWLVKVDVVGNGNRKEAVRTLAPTPPSIEAWASVPHLQVYMDPNSLKGAQPTMVLDTLVFQVEDRAPSPSDPLISTPNPFRGGSELS